MRRLFVFLALVLSISLASSAIIITTQSDSIYNLGETVSVPISIIAESETNNFFSANLNCPNKITEITKYPLFLSTGEQKQDTIILPLKKVFIGESLGECRITLGIQNKEQTSTNLFTLSNLIIITFTSETPETKPQEIVYISGIATKENSVNANGFAEIIFSDAGIPSIIESKSVITEGKFTLNVTFPEKTKAGSYYGKVKVYEKDGTEISNIGENNYRINLAQVPTAIEIQTKNTELDPGTELKFTPVILDQTGEPINSDMTITIKNEKKKIIFETEKKSGEEIIYTIGPQMAPGEWIISAKINELFYESKVNIKEKESIETSLVNNTLSVTNTGNVQYAKELEVFIGNEKRLVSLNLDPGENKNYILTAPDGNYDVQVGEFKSNVALTGKTVDIKTPSANFISALNAPLSWLILLLILIIIGFFLVRRRTKQNFGHFSTKGFSIKSSTTPVSHNLSVIEDKKTTRENKFNSKNPAEVSMSLKGERQKSTLVCLKLKNYSEIADQKGSPAETLQKIINIIEAHNAYTYLNKDSITFIFAPIKTKTFDNEKVSLSATDKMQELIKSHNRNYKQKIDYGIGIDNVDIIAKLTQKGMMFMPLGSSMTNLRRMTASAQNEIVLSENVKTKIATNAKVERRQGLEGYALKEIRNTEVDKKMLSDLKKRIGEY